MQPESETVDLRALVIGHVAVLFATLLIVFDGEYK